MWQAFSSIASSLGCRGRVNGAWSGIGLPCIHYAFLACSPVSCSSTVQAATDRFDSLSASPFAHIQSPMPADGSMTLYLAFPAYNIVAPPGDSVQPSSFPAGNSRGKYIPLKRDALAAIVAAIVAAILAAIRAAIRAAIWRVIWPV